MANYNNAGVGNVGAADAAVLALLADTSRAGRGGMYGGGYGGYGGEGGWGGYGGGPFGGFSSNAVRADRNGESIRRNGEDAHFFELSSQARSDFNLLNLQQQNNMLATQQQISQLALQLCECCGDLKATQGRLEGRLDCIGNSIPQQVQIEIDNQTIADLRAQLGNGGNNGQPPWWIWMLNGNGGPPGPPFGRNGVAT